MILYPILSGQASIAFGAGSSGIFGSAAAGAQTPTIGGNALDGGGLFGKGGGSPHTGSPAPFGSSTPSSGGLFGKLASTPGFDLNSTGSAGLFGKGISTPQPQNASIFGAGSTVGLFGKSPITSQTTGIFGSSTSSQGFQQTASVFGGSSSNHGAATPNVFGNSQNLTADAKPLFGAGTSPNTSQTVPSPTKKQKSSVYSELSDLMKDELVQFQAQFFTLGKIPTRPPPRELIQI